LHHSPRQPLKLGEPGQNLTQRSSTEQLTVAFSKRFSSSFTQIFIAQKLYLILKEATVERQKTSCQTCLAIGYY
jgi:hypothetical protein